MPTIADEANQILRKADAEVDRLADAVNLWIGWLPSGVQASVRVEWERGLGLWRGLVETLDQLLANPGLPAIQTYAWAWNRDVGGGAAALAARADPGYTRIQRYWEGAGVDAYLAVLPAQRTALEGVKETLSDPVAVMLDEFGRRIERFWQTVIDGIWFAYGATVGAVIVCLNPTGIPFGVAAFVGGLAKAVSQVTTAYGELRLLAAQQQNLLEQALYDDSAFPDGGWPSSTDRGITDA